MTISESHKQLILEEETVLKDVYASLREQLKRDLVRFSIESERARELTAALVGASRAEDKQMLASDEAVSHELTDQKKKDVTAIDTLLKKPYFARILLEEETPSGDIKPIEYKLGFAANPDCRIVDWRKAPIAKLYYEYKEGDEYSEEILGRDRTGIVKKRHTVDIVKEAVVRLSCGAGTFERGADGNWNQRGGNQERTREKGALPEILALITPDQFRLITEDATSAVLIQGIAGSGKTTVALHRLAWLLHEGNSPLAPQDALIIVLSQALKRYIENTLPRMGILGVKIVTFPEFAATHLKTILPQFFTQSGTIARPAAPSPSSFARVKRSLAVLTAVEEIAKRGDTTSPTEIVLKALGDSRKIVALDDSKLLSEDIVKGSYAHTQKNFAAHVLDPDDDALLLRASEIIKKGVSRPNSSVWGHIVLDEIQDASSAEISAVLGAVKDPSHVTLVGDSSQQFSANGGFPGWDKLRERWAFTENISTFVSLKISHRSTLPIMKFADAIQQRALVTEGRPGRPPIWFRCRSESEGLQAAREWLAKAMERYPSAISTVICATSAESKFVKSLLAPTFGGAVRIGDEHSFSFDEGIVVTTPKDSKGLEFTNVLVWNPSEQTYPLSPESRNALYVAVTRAEENLALVTFKAPSRVLPSFSSPLIRAVDLRPEEELASNE